MPRPKKVHPEVVPPTENLATDYLSIEDNQEELELEEDFEEEDWSSCDDDDFGDLFEV